jgi:hypothetical protein
MKRFLGNLALSAGALAVAFGLGEVVVRAMFAETNVLFPRYHTGYQYGKYTLRGVRPSSTFRHTSVDGAWTFATNSKGFRNTREFAYRKPEGTLRLLALGDSHTQGYEVRQAFTYAAVAERLLNARGVRAEAINAGVSGYSTAEALAFLENEGARYQPDVVVLGFYANDFEDNLKAGLFALESGGLVEKKHAHLPGVKIQDAIYSLAPVRWLSEHSYFYSLLFNAVWEHFKALAAKAARESAPQTEYAVSKQEGPSPAELELATALVVRMHEFSRANGIRLIVADIPRRADNHGFDTSLPEPMAARLKAAGVELISSAELLAPFHGAAEVHVPHGHQHISEFTHTLIGAEVARRAGTMRAPAPAPGIVPVRH